MMHGYRGTMDDLLMRIFSTFCWYPSSLHMFVCCVLVGGCVYVCACGSFYVRLIMGVNDGDSRLIILNSKIVLSTFPLLFILAFSRFSTTARLTLYNLHPSCYSPY